MEHPRLATLVAVQWKANLFDAKVLHVPPAGEMDVVYDIAGSVGVFLTMEEHGLKLFWRLRKRREEERRRNVQWVGAPTKSPQESSV